VITHSVAFKLNHQANSPEEKLFLQKAKELSSLPTVKDFQILKQVSPKNHFSFALSMNFASQEAYNAYNNHPQHVDFVENIWLVEVEDFLELDYEVYV